MDVFISSVTELKHPYKVQISDNKDMVNFHVSYFLHQIPLILNFSLPSPPSRYMGYCLMLSKFGILKANYNVKVWETQSSGPPYYHTLCERITIQFSNYRFLTC